MEFIAKLLGTGKANLNIANEDISHMPSLYGNAENNQGSALQRQRQIIENIRASGKWISTAPVRNSCYGNR